jgi:hypothetical protein
LENYCWGGMRRLGQLYSQFKFFMLPVVSLFPLRMLQLVNSTILIYCFIMCASLIYSSDIFKLLFTCNIAFDAVFISSNSSYYAKTSQHHFFLPYSVQRWLLTPYLKFFKYLPWITRGLREIDDTTSSGKLNIYSIAADDQKYILL